MTAICRRPRILERRLRIKDCPGEIRQIAVTGPGHEKPALLPSNQMDALSAAVPLRIDPDVQPTLVVGSLCRIPGIRVGQGFEAAKARTIFRKPVNASAAITITEDEIIVTLGRRTNNPLLLAARYGEIAQPIPWLGNPTLRIRFF